MIAQAVASGTADVQGYTGVCYFKGYNFREAAGSPAIASLTIRAGTSTAGAPLAEVALLASTTVQGNVPNNSATSAGIYCPTGVFIDRNAGTTVGVIYVEPA